jgi:tetratricopeptide (TPR) repeat protein
VAMVLRAQGKRAEAIRAYDAAIRLDSTERWAYRQKAALLVELKRPDEAVRTMKALVRVAPNDDESHFLLADFLLDLDRPAEALPHYEAAVRLDSADAANRHDMGLALLRVGRTEEALRAFQAALELNSGLNAARANAFDATLAIGRTEEALRVADEWRKHAADDDPAPHVARGIALRTLGRTKDARKALDEALERDSANYVARINRGLAYLQETRFDEALRDAQVATRLDSTRVNGWALAGFASLGRERCDDVLTYWTEASKLQQGFLDQRPEVRQAWNECRKRTAGGTSRQ